jgi:alkylated DNA repair dioxygenase AlkB
VEYDLIYLDGLHQFEQTYRDLQNSFQHAAPNALILVDDTVPADEFSANPDGLEAYRLREAAGHINTGAWHGDVYKVILALDEVARKKVEWATLVDLSNPKTLIYCKPGQPWPKLPAINPDKFSLENFHRNFSQSINPRFKPKTREQLLIELRN